MLDPQIEVVDCLLEQIAHIEDKISNERLRNGSDPKIKFAASVYKMEIGRIRFTISSYLRTRLEKIQSFIFHLLGLEEKVRYIGFRLKRKNIYNIMNRIRRVPTRFQRLLYVSLRHKKVIHWKKMDCTRE